MNGPSPPKRIAYLQCASGIAGDMLLGALIDAGASLETIQAGIASLGLESCKLEIETVQRHSFRATKLHVRHGPQYAHTHLHQIVERIDASILNDAQTQLAKRIFRRLGEAEALAHGSTLESVHFHEVGAVDSIADIVGSAIAIDLLQIGAFYSTPVPTGHGTVEIAHGRTAIPAPATVELLKGIPLMPCDIEFELTTPTGAAILAELAVGFGPLPAMTVESTGCGAGSRDLAAQANVLRVLVGTASEDLPGRSDSDESDEVLMLETNVDDTTGELMGYCLDQLMQAGALDAFATPIQMKKSRPAVTLTVICRPVDGAALERLLFCHTTTIGIRSWTAKRRKLRRERMTVTTPWGPIEGKRIQMPDGSLRFAPEFESCREAAERVSQPLLTRTNGQGTGNQGDPTGATVQQIYQEAITQFTKAQRT